MAVAMAESQIGLVLTEVISQERQEAAAFTRIGSWVIGGSTVLGMAATSGAILLDRPGLLIASTAASVIGMMHGLGRWFGATDRQDEIPTIQAFAKVWERMYTDHHEEQNFARSIY